MKTPVNMCFMSGDANPLKASDNDRRFLAIILKPRRIQLSRAAGWRMPPNTVKVDRTTRWGNPFVVGRDGTQAECVEAFGFIAGEEASLELMARMQVPPCGLDATKKVLAELEADPKPLRGKNLACWCRLDEPCHADVLLRLANAVLSGARTGLDGA